MARIEIKTIPAMAEMVEKAVEDKKAEDKTVKKVTKRKTAKKEE